MYILIFRLMLFQVDVIPLTKDTTIPSWFPAYSRKVEDVKFPVYSRKLEVMFGKCDFLFQKLAL